MYNDMFSNSGKRSADDSMRVISACPVCHRTYTPLEARVLDENDGAHLLYIKCRYCHSALLALVLANNLGISSIGMLTDLESQEVNKFRAQASLTADDVIAIHHELAAGKVPLPEEK